MALLPVTLAYHTARVWSPKTGTLERTGTKHEEVLVLADGRAV